MSFFVFCLMCTRPAIILYCLEKQGHLMIVDERYRISKSDFAEDAHLSCVFGH